MGWKDESSKAAFISDMKASGFSQDEIDREVSSIEGTQSPASTAPLTSTTKSVAEQTSSSPFALNPEAPAETLKQMGEAREQQGNTLLGNITPPSGMGGGGGSPYDLLAAYGLYKGAQTAGTGLKNKFFGPSVPEKPPVESAMLPQAAQLPTSHEQWVASLSPEERMLYERSQEAKAAKTNTFPLTQNEPYLEPERPIVASETAPPTPEQIRQAKLTAATQVAQQNMATPVTGSAAPPANAPKKVWEPPTASLAVSAPATPTTAPVEITTPPVEAPKAKPAAAAQPPSIESKLGKPTLITGSGMPAYEGQGAEGSKLKHKEGKFASLNDIPKGTVFVPGGNYMDTLRNAVGQQAFTENLKATGGYPASNEATAVQARAINASLNRPTREQAIAQGLSLGEPTPPITKKVGGKKLVSVAGVTGALIALPDLANAAQNQDAASAGRLSNTAGALGLATMMGRAVPAVPPTLPTLGQSIGGRSVNMNPDFLNQLLR